MATHDTEEQKYLHAARVITAENESSLSGVSELIRRGEQFLVIIPYGKSREAYDTLTERIIETVEQ